MSPRFCAETAGMPFDERREEEMTAKSLEETLSAKDAREVIASDGGRALDIRDDEEWDEGRIPGAVHLAEEVVVERLEEFPEDTAIVVVCADGERSAKLAARLREEGQQAASIEGGMEAWEGEGLPMQPRDHDEFKGPDYGDAGQGG